MTIHTFKIIQNEIEVANGSCNDKERIEREALHYVNVYSRDGALKLFIDDKEINKYIIT